MKACYGCYQVGRAYRYGTGAEKNADRAKEYLEKGCTLGCEESCKERKELDKPAPAAYAGGPCNATSWHAVCGGKCVDTARTTRHCGACNQRCPAQTFCREGRCRDANGGYWSTE